jgi:uncharacterized cysteine cluster protein YcgN (CxxCxxCC family)
MPKEPTIGARDSAEGAPAAAEAHFWATKPLEAMTHAEWESLCDGCGQCCLIKVEEEVTGDIYLTRLACQLLDTHTCRCRNYADRRAGVPDCVTISAANVGDIEWLPKSCAYRRIAEGRGRGRSDPQRGEHRGPDDERCPVAHVVSFRDRVPQSPNRQIVKSSNDQMA